MRAWFVVVGLTLIAFTNTAPAQPDPAPLPDKADLRAEFEAFGFTAKSQGRRNACSLFAVTGAAEFEMAKSAGQRPVRLSEEYLIWAANEAAGNSTDQAMFYEALFGLQEFGLCSEKKMPYTATTNDRRRPSTTARREAIVRRDWHPIWIKRWDLKTGLSSEQITQLKRELAAGHPVAVGLRWPKNVRLGADQIIETPSSADVFDGHSVLFVGYRNATELAGGGVFTFRNSDGPGWGDGGYAALTYDYVSRYANDAVALHFAPDDSPRDSRGRIWLEAETLPFTSSGCSADAQAMEAFGARLWSDGKHLLGGCNQGGHVEFAVPVRQTRRYTVSVYATCAPDFGEYTFAIDGTPIGPPFDAYSGRVHPSGQLDLGEIDLAAGLHRLRVTASARNPLSEGFKIGLDAVELIPVN